MARKRGMVLWGRKPGHGDWGYMGGWLRLEHEPFGTDVTRYTKEGWEVRLEAQGIFPA